MLSENTLVFMDQDEIEIEFLSNNYRKRVSFSAPVMKRKSMVKFIVVEKFNFFRLLEGLFCKNNPGP